ncbi:MAG TPA: hypothetical protein PKA90_06265 [Ignavibacteria bacterium]|nr:hypothetical protein [Ignavibacteria bacterium]HMR40019.1 hypothetical protein [Ignavibacteria bacterium]
MKIIYTILFLLSVQAAFSQTITETEIFNLTFNGDADPYYLKYDKTGTNYAYVYRINDENKNFIISQKNLSDKYDYIEPLQIVFDKEGNYYTIATDYKEDYGADNYFLIVNGEQIKNYSYIEQYSSFLNKQNEYVFIFKTGEKYRIGYYSINSGFRQSEEYDNIRPTFNSEMLSNQTEGDMVAYDEKFFFKNKKDERVFLATKYGKTSMISESEEIKTDYADINEGSLVYNKNNELSYIAKKTGRFYEYTGGELVVSGNKTYKSFPMVSMPLVFDQNNEPVYVAADSIGDYRYSYYVVVGNDKQPFPSSGNTADFPSSFSTGISDLKVSSDGVVSYIGNSEIIIASSEKSGDGNSYDDYYTKSFLVENNKAYELGYNIGQIVYNAKGEMLYSGIANISKKERLLLMNYGESRIILNKKKYDDIYDYGFTPSGDVFYGGQTYDEKALNNNYQTTLFIGDKNIGSYSFLAYQYYKDSSYILAYGPGNKYAFSAAEYVDSVNNKYVVVTNEGVLPFPSNVSGTDKFLYISNLIYTVNDKIFYIADTKMEPVTYAMTKEAFADNVSLGKTYDNIYDFDYDKSINEASFTASRGKVIYRVRVKF